MLSFYNVVCYWLAFQEEMRRNFTEILPDYMEKLEKLLENNNNDDKYFVGDKVGSLARKT